MQPDYHNLPRRNWPLPRALGNQILKRLGWQIPTPLPDLPKMVLAVAPHTSNWDFVIGMAAALSLDLDANWLGKDSLFKGPLHGLLVRLGGIPVDRSRPAGILDQVVTRIHLSERIILGLAPEGTRKPVTSWKSGCCRIAQQACIPLVPIAIDYAGKRLRVLPHWIPQGDPEVNLRRLSACFSAEMARRPENFLSHQSPA